MPVVRLGPMRFGWCLNCNIPIVDVRFECALCGSKAGPVSVTPPGDVRPAFHRDLEILRDVADSQFGRGCGTALVPDDRPVVLNKAPALDRMEEVVVDGAVVCTLRYDLETGYRILPRMEGARRLAGPIERNWVVVDDDAAPHIIAGASVMVPGISDAYPGIEKGEEVVVLDQRRGAIATGLARMDGAEMLSLERGAATKTRLSSEPAPPRYLKDGRTWSDAVKGNSKAMECIVAESTGFIKRTAEKHGLPVAVSFSGGKDSLATLLLALDAGLSPSIIFIDTGLEFKETVDYVRSLSSRLGLELVSADAGEAFWDGLKVFGPPAKDFRWCCKSCKLAPTTRLIRERYPGGVLSLIGQRRYESQQRASKGRVWKNPWVPGQLAASPVQDWTALHIWLYIFGKGVEYNPWYDRGLERIGCLMCPSSDMAELGLVESSCPDFLRWRDYLEERARALGYGMEWVEMGLWRWKDPPEELREYFKAPAAGPRGANLELRLAEGQSPCAEGLSSEGVFGSVLDLDRMRNLMNVLGKVALDPGIKACRTEGMLVFGDGAVVIKGRDAKALKDKAGRLERVARKAMLCVGCGICAGLCENGAIEVRDGKAWIDEERCTHCGKCLAPCPAADFAGEFRF